MCSRISKYKNSTMCSRRMHNSTSDLKNKYKTKISFYSNIKIKWIGSMHSWNRKELGWNFAKNRCGWLRIATVLTC